MAKEADRAKGKLEEGEGDEDDEQEEGENIEEAKEFLDAIKENMEQNKGRKYKVWWWDSGS